MPWWLLLLLVLGWAIWSLRYEGFVRKAVPWCVLFLALGVFLGQVSTVLGWR